MPWARNKRPHYTQVGERGCHNTEHGKGGHSFYKLANFWKQPGKGIDNIYIWKKIRVFVELDATELFISHAFNFLKLWKVVLFYYGRIASSFTQIHFASIKLNQLFNCTVSYGSLLFLLTKKGLEYKKFINFLKLPDVSKRNSYKYIPRLMSCRTWLGKCSLGRLITHFIFFETMNTW